jgi:hypothetical protein
MVFQFGGGALILRSRDRQLIRTLVQAGEIGYRAKAVKRPLVNCISERFTDALFGLRVVCLNPPFPPFVAYLPARWVFNGGRRFLLVGYSPRHCHLSHGRISYVHSSDGSIGSSVWDFCDCMALNSVGRNTFLDTVSRSEYVLAKLGIKSALQI